MGGSAVDYYIDCPVYLWCVYRSRAGRAVFQSASAGSLLDNAGNSADNRDSCLPTASSRAGPAADSCRLCPYSRRRAVGLARGARPSEKTVLDREVIPPEFLDEYDSLMTKENRTFERKPLQESMAAFEEQVIRDALIANNWNQSKAARDLRISERTIRYKREKLMIKKPIES